MECPQGPMMLSSGYSMFRVRRLPSILLWLFFTLGYIMLGSSKLEKTDDIHRTTQSEASERVKGGISRGMHYVDAATDQQSSGEEGHIVVNEPRNLQPRAKRTKHYQNIVSQDSIAIAGLRGEFAKLSEGIHAGQMRIGLSPESADFISSAKAVIKFRLQLRCAVRTLPTALHKLCDSSAPSGLTPSALEVSSLEASGLMDAIEAKIAYEIPQELAEAAIFALGSVLPADESFLDLLQACRKLAGMFRKSLVASALLAYVGYAAEDHAKAPSDRTVLRMLGRGVNLAEQHAVFINDLRTTATNRGTFSNSTHRFGRPWFSEYIAREKRLISRVYNLMGRHYFNMGKWRLAIEALQNAINADYYVPEALEWMARAFDRSAEPRRFFSTWRQALAVNPYLSDRNVWPIFCLTVDRATVIDTPRLSIYRERSFLKRKALELEFNERAQNTDPNNATSSAKNRFVALMDVVGAIRKLECTPEFVGDRNVAMHNYHASIKASDPQRDYSYINFAYGMVFYHGFSLLFSDVPAARAAIVRSQNYGLEWISFGANVGTETMYASLTWGLKASGYDVLCNLVDHALHFREQFAVPHVEFYCRDALDADLSNAGIVWIDNQSWDHHLTNAIFAKLQKDLPPRALVIEYAAADFHANANLMLGNHMELVGCRALDVSWDNNHGTQVSIFRKRDAPFSGKYNDWIDYSQMLKKIFKSTKMMVDHAFESGHGSITDGPLSPEAGQPSLRRQLHHLEEVTSADPSILSASAWTDKVLSLHQHIMFNWVCHCFFNFHGAMSQEELDYVYKYISVAGDEFRAYNLDGSWVGNRMSSISYSFGLDTETESMDSARLRLGTTSMFKELWEVAQRILRARGIVLPPYLGLEPGRPQNANFSFHGLGWDFNEGIFKVSYSARLLPCVPDRDTPHEQRKRE